MCASEAIREFGVRVRFRRWGRLGAPLVNRASLRIFVFSIVLPVSTNTTSVFLFYRLDTHDQGACLTCRFRRSSVHCVSPSPLSIAPRALSVSL